jgi:putative selenate reductase
VTLELDTLIVAIGQRPDLAVLDGVDVELSPDGFVVVDPATLATSQARVWAGGDLVAPGPSSIVEACGDGRRIAEAILVREGLLEARREPPPPPEELDLAGLLRRRSGRVPRVETPRRTWSTTPGFVEIVGTLSPDAARREAARCLDCDWLCSTCEGVCPNRAIVTYRATPWRSRKDAFSVRQEPQVAVLADLCNECGNCATFCPTAGRPWHDKPRLFWHRGDFEAESDNAFMLLVRGGGTLIQARGGGELHQLRDGDVVRYHGPDGAARLDRDTLEITAGVEPPVALRGAMLTLLRGITSSMPQLPVAEAEPGWMLGGER